MYVLFLLLLAAPVGHDEALTPLSIATNEPVAIEYSRGYFERSGAKWVEDHRNAFERGVYDAGGRLIGIVKVDLVDTAIKVKQSLNAAARATDVTFYSAGGFQGRTVFQYGPQGRLLETQSFDDEGALVEKRQTVYSKRGLAAVTNVFRRLKGSDEPSHLFEEQFAYDKEGKLAKRTVTKLHPKKTLVRITAYGAAGTVATEQAYDEWGDLKDTFVYAYDFDDSGAWSKQLKQRVIGKSAAPELVPVDVIYRKIVPLTKR